MALRKKTQVEKDELKKEKRSYKKFRNMDVHKEGQLSLLRALADGIKHCNFGAIRVERL